MIQFRQAFFIIITVFLNNLFIINVPAQAINSILNQKSNKQIITKDTIKFGVFANLGVEQTTEQYKPIVDYISQVLPQYELELFVGNMSEIYHKIENGELDIITTNPAHYIVTRHKFPLTGILATIVPVDVEGNPVYNLGGCIVTLSKRVDINNLKDIRNKKVAIPSLEHLGGYRAQAYELALAGVDPDEYELVPKQIHQEAIRALLRGEVDVAFVRSGIIEKMVKDGEINMEQIKLINEQKFDHFNLRSSTRLYPEWPVFALPKVDNHKVKQFTIALLSLEPTHPAALKARIYGYQNPACYLIIENLSKKLRLPPFENYGKINLSEFVNQFWEEILGVLIVLAMLIVLFIREKRASKKLKEEITQRKRLEEMLQSTLRQRDLLATHVPGVLFQFQIKPNGSSHFPYTSKGIENIFGVKSEQVIDDATPIMKVIHPEDLENFRETVQNSADKLELCQTQARIIHPDGRTIWIEVEATPQALDDGSIIWHGYIRDISQKRKMEEELNKYSKRLENAIEELRITALDLETNLFEKNQLIDELEKTRSALELSNNEKDKLFSIISHDLRSPFNAFLGLTKMMYEDIDNLSHAEIKNFSKVLNESATNFFQLLENLLSWSHLKQNIMSVNPEKLNLEQLIMSAYNALKTSFENKNQSFYLNLQNNLCVYAEQKMAETVIRNLLSNASKFTHKGGNITISAKSEGDYVLVSVKDTGIGIPEKIFDKLFVIGEKTSRKGTDREPSSGLGLILCNEFIQKNGGKLWVESQEGIGSIFYFTLPACSGIDKE